MEKIVSDNYQKSAHVTASKMQGIFRTKFCNIAEI